MTITWGRYPDMWQARTFVLEASPIAIGGLDAEQ